jgi:hypothetical protein
MTRPELIKAIEDNGAQFKGYKRAPADALQAAYDALPPAPKPRANYGANENPRHCRHCGSTNSRIRDTKPFHRPERTVRYRVCGDCGKRFSTLEVTV